MAAALRLVTAGLFLACAPYAHAAFISIDSFEYPDPGRVFFAPGLPPWGDGNPLVHQDPWGLGNPSTPEVLGGQRDILVKVDGTALPISAAGIIGYETVYQTGLLQVATFGTPGTYVVAQYDGRDIETGTSLVDAEALGLVDLTASGENGKIQLRFLSLDAGDARALVTSVTAVGSSGSTTLQRAIPESSVPFQYDIPLADFSDPSVFAGLKSMTLKFNASDRPVPNVDFELDYIAAVPEPATLAMLGGLGGCALVAGGWCWRRKRIGRRAAWLSVP